MILAVILGIGAGVGCVGMVWALKPRVPTLDSIAVGLNRPATSPLVDGADQSARPGRGRGQKAVIRAINRYSVGLIDELSRSKWVPYSRWQSLGPALAITAETPQGLVAKMLVVGGIALLAPPVLWLIAVGAGLSIPIAIPAIVTLGAVPIAAALPVISMTRDARDRQRHARTVIGNFVDLVVLSLAGGVGVEGSLMAAAQVSSDWAAVMMARVLARARESGQSPWLALGLLGEEIGVPELVEIATTLELAGTEGARIRQSLSARAASLRRHEQADVESAANALTERLFLPGSLLLLGFLLFVGYPAFSRIVGGF